MTQSSKETIALAEGIDLNTHFLEEVKRLLKCGGIDSNAHNSGAVLKAGAENVVMNVFSSRVNHTDDYKNLQHF